MRKSIKIITLALVYLRALASKRGGGGGTAGNNNNASSGSSSPIIFAFWTPFLLLHLGGPDTITAYSLEDNELWLRHLIGLLFELFSACVIFFCSLHGNPMIPATVLMFIVGIIKYAERTYSLYSGSVDGFRNKILDDPDPGPNYAKLMTEFDAKEKAGLVVEIAIANGEAEEAHKEMEKQETMRLVQDKNKSVEARAYEFFLIFRRLFVNVILSFKERRLSQAFFLERDDMKGRGVQGDRGGAQLHLRHSVHQGARRLQHARLGAPRHLLLLSRFRARHLLLPRQAWAPDPARRRRHHVRAAAGWAGARRGGAAHDFLLQPRPGVPGVVQVAQVAGVAEGGHQAVAGAALVGKTSQLNLIEYCLGKPGNYSNKGLKPAAEMLKAKGKGDIMEMCNCRGNRVIQRHATEIKKNIENNDEVKHLAMDKIKKSLEEKDEAKRLSMDDIDKIKAEVATEKFRLILDSVEQSDFDESLLLWHIATDLCGLQNKITAPTADEDRLRPIGETLSEYMLYLLIKQPEMLAATAGIGLLRATGTRARRRAVVKGDRSKSVLFDAVILAKELRKLDDWLMREVVTGVWGEMLTYAAGKCRGNMHVRQLSRGGELITLVWFLMAHMGLGDMYQIQEGDAKAKLIVKDQ
ncbi:unnamed protein product [Miscanthus lutarioriparius]|uniref:DUF4220 domain-containing protein n=1 Tax=Miscanthus lutarioriparius TaxID=422564 RepID=A0A811NDH4_9POAL|nr:unnamed protein product [Miscanthus lutarioriparius]